MSSIPSTSVTLLKAISRDSDSVRWAEFVKTYEPLMRGFLHERFPSIEPEDAMQETLIALVKALPDYRYTPDTRGHFRNYLMGILKNKASDLLRRRAREDTKHRGFAEESATGRRNGRDDRRDQPYLAGEEAEEAAFRESTREAAIEQLMSNERISPVTREIFRHVALMQESPECVAAQFGTSRNNVDQIKNRMIARLAEMIRAMSAGR